MTRVFLSYARGDDGELFDPASSFIARLHGALTTAAFDVWFDRVSMPSRALTFHQEIREAVAACDRLVLVVGPKASESLYVRQEWQFAYFEAEKIVTPILRRGDYSNVPDELKLLHCEDFRDDGQYEFHLQNLIRQLAEPAPALGKLIGVPSLPPHFLSRTDRLAALRDALRADLDRPVVITGSAARVGMHGMGGIGKSVLAATLSRDRKIREAFPDGIVWVGLGPLPAVADLQRRVHKDLGGDGAFQTEHEGRVKLRDILKDKGVLLVLDDVWRRADVDWFDVLGPRCRAMITTRDAGLLTSLGGVRHQVELLTDAEAQNLLAQAAGVERDKLLGEAADLIAECGRLPLAVALCGGLIRHGFAWAKVLEQLRASRIDRIKDPHAAKVEHESIWNAIDVSVKFLTDDEQKRFIELAVFPADEATPITALRTLWSHTAGFDDWDTDALVIKLSQRSLLRLPISWIHPAGGDWDTACNWSTNNVPGSGDGIVIGSLNSEAAVPAGNKLISLHDLVYDYVHRAVGDEAALHHRLLEGYRKKCPKGWHVDPPNDGYFFTHLREHLIAAGRAGELADLLQELCWLETKAESGLTFDLTADFREVLGVLSTDDARWTVLRLLDEALRADVHFLAWHPTTLFQCLWNRCWWYDCPEAASHYDPPKPGIVPPWQAPGPKLFRLMEAWRAAKEKATPGFVWLRSLRPPPVHLGTTKAVLRGHTNEVSSVACSPDGRVIASACFGGGLRFWTADDGASLHSIHTNHEIVLSMAFSPDGRHLVSGGLSSLGYDTATMVRIWDVQTGAELRALHGHENRVNSVAFSRDGLLIASGSDDWTVRVWDAATGAEVLVLHHPCKVYSVAFGLRADVAPPLFRLLYPCEDNSVAFSQDNCLASGGADNKVRVWDTATGAALYTLERHHAGVKSVRFSSDGQFLASGANDRTLLVQDEYDIHVDLNSVPSLDYDTAVRVWDATRGATFATLHTLHGHSAGINGVAFSPDSRLIASASDDGTVRVWDARTGTALHTLEGHQGLVLSVAFSPNGRIIVSGATDHTVRLWDAARSTMTYTLPVHKGTLKKLKELGFTRDGRLLISVGEQFDLITWDAERATVLNSLPPHPVTAAYLGATRTEMAIVYKSLPPHLKMQEKPNFQWASWSEVQKSLPPPLEEHKHLERGALVHEYAGDFLESLRNDLNMTALALRNTDMQIAWFPGNLYRVAPGSSDRLWAGSDWSYVWLVVLEGRME